MTDFNQPWHTSVAACIRVSVRVCICVCVCVCYLCVNVCCRAAEILMGKNDRRFRFEHLQSNGASSIFLIEVQTFGVLCDSRIYLVNCYKNAGHTDLTVARSKGQERWSYRFDRGSF